MLLNSSVAHYNVAQQGRRRVVVNRNQFNAACMLQLRNEFAKCGAAQRRPVLFTRIRSDKSKDTTVAKKGKGWERNRKEGGRKVGRKRERWTIESRAEKGENWTRRSISSRLRFWSPELLVNAIMTYSPSIFLSFFALFLFPFFLEPICVTHLLSVHLLPRYWLFFSFLTALSEVKYPWLL